MSDKFDYEFLYEIIQICIRGSDHKLFYANWIYPGGKYCEKTNFYQMYFNDNGSPGKGLPKNKTELKQALEHLKKEGLLEGDNKDGYTVPNKHEKHKDQKEFPKYLEKMKSDILEELRRLEDRMEFLNDKLLTIGKTIDMIDEFNTTGQLFGFEY